MTSFKSHERAAFNGLGLAIVRALPGQPGAITLRAKSASLPNGDATLRIEAKQP